LRCRGFFTGFIIASSVILSVLFGFGYSID